LFISQHPVGTFHSVFSQVGHFLGNQTFTEVELLAASVNHGRLP
jgi:hypothetical protein